MEVTVETHRAIPVTAGDTSQIGNARRQAAALASALDLDQIEQGQVGIIVTEAARNIATHAGSGQIVLSPWRINGKSGLDIFAIDQGKGISDMERALTDGYSTAGTAGQGLGAISRMAAEFHVYSTAQGTVLFARVAHGGGDHGAPRSNFGAIALPLSGESISGDAWSSHQSPERSLYIVADGLGHGPLAAEAAREAIRTFHLELDYPPEQILKKIHGALAKTRGAAVSIAEILHNRRVINYAGVGNVATATWSRGKSRSLVSMNGTIGHTVPKIQAFPYPYEPDSLLIMHSDGLGTRWSLEQYAGLAQRHPALTAAVLFRDFSRKRDDATIVVSRIQSE